MKTNLSDDMSASGELRSFSEPISKISTASWVVSTILLILLVGVSLYSFWMYKNLTTEINLLHDDVDIKTNQLLLLSKTQDTKLNVLNTNESLADIKESDELAIPAKPFGQLSKIYKDEEYGYTFFYPNEARISTKVLNEDERKDATYKKTLIIGIDAKYTEGYVKNLSDGTEMNINIYSIDKGTSPKELLSRHVSITAFDVTKHTVAGLDAYTVKFQFPDWNQYTEIIRSDINYEFGIAVKGGNQLEKLEVANKIISTFQFLDN